LFIDSFLEVLSIGGSLHLSVIFDLLVSFDLITGLGIDASLNREL
jgi:hypothetical protein